MIGHVVFISQSSLARARYVSVNADHYGIRQLTTVKTSNQNWSNFYRNWLFSMLQTPDLIKVNRVKIPLGRVSKFGNASTSEVTASPL